MSSHPSVTNEMVKRIEDICKTASQQAVPHADIATFVIAEYERRHGEKITETQAQLAAILSLLSRPPAPEPQARLCHCGTCAEAAAAAHRWIDQMLVNDCMAWTMQVITAAALEMRRMAEAIAASEQNDEGYTAEQIRDQLVVSMSPHTRKGPYTEKEWAGPTH